VPSKIIAEHHVLNWLVFVLMLHCVGCSGPGAHLPARDL
jgi:hypothetical protein